MTDANLSAPRWRLATLLTACVLGLGLVACGDDDDDGDTEEATTEATAGPTELTLTADEYTFELSETPTAPGDVTLTFVNEGEEQHALIFAKLGEGYTVDEAFELEGRKGSAEVVGEAEAGPGEEAMRPVEATLEPGNYAMLCPIQKGKQVHYELGQLVEFTIE